MFPGSIPGRPTRKEIVMIYTNNKFTGHWPVGTAAIVVAPDSEQAARLLERKLDEIGLAQDVKADDMEEFKLHDGMVKILLDGDY